jgi:alkanesulfonate monooxygenase SsuD/methylene tetrahydromethanopterin reductase-like flavin-dependent oxidoreductase (luciferase family)
MAIDVGVGLWCMRSTAAAPANAAVLYGELQDDARLVEELGFHSLWLSEHHFWYDGWCPALLVAGASALGATSHLHVGTGVFLLPLHEPERVAAAVRALEQLAPGRFELGAGIGYRDPELDGFGISRRQRGRRTDHALDVLADVWQGPPRIWIGGIAERSLRRAAERGLGLFLPSSMRPAQLRAVIEQARETAEQAGVELGRVGVLKDTWLIGAGDDEAGVARGLAEQTREYAGSWWLLDGRLGFDVPELLDAQMRRSAETALVGTPDVLLEGIAELEAVGVDLVVLQVRLDAARHGYRDQLRRLGAEVLPAVGA